MEPTTTVPLHGPRDATLFAFDHLVQARHTIADGMIAHLDADIAAAHLMRDSGRGTGTQKGIENKVAGISCDLEDTLDQRFWLWCFKYLDVRKQLNCLFFRRVVCADLVS